MVESYVKLGIAALLPVIASAALYLLDKKTKFKEIKPIRKQIIFGVVFGILAIIGTEWGIPMNGAMVNCRDAAVITAGLMFGGPAGIIAGLIGGIERWIAVWWGVGKLTRVACTLSTIIAGFYSAALRKYLFENKKPGWLISFAVGVVMEVFHMMMVFFTNMSDTALAMSVVRSCTIPMVVANAASVLIAAVVITLLRTKPESNVKKSNVHIAQTIQKWLLVTVTVAFLSTSAFIFAFQDRVAEGQTDSLLDIAIQSVAADIGDTSDANLLRLTRGIAADLSEPWAMTKEELCAVAEKFDVTEINFVDKNGFIVATTEDTLGFDMASGKQSKEFLCLLGDTQELVQDYGPISLDTSTFRKYAGVKFGEGFIQVGNDAEHFQRDIDGQVVSVAKNRHVGETGYVFILDEDLTLVSAPHSKEQALSAEGAVSVDLGKHADEQTTFVQSIGGESCYGRVVRIEGYYVVSVLPEAEALQMRNITLYVNTFMEILVFAVLFALIYLLIKKVVVNQIKKINGSLSRIAGGDLETVVNVRTSEEFASLSDDINSTVDTLKHYIAEASARIDKELEFAKNIQGSALPNVFPAFPKRRDFDIFACMDPAKEVGGDFYDFYMTHDEKLHFLVADVSGKGIPAAMFMMRAKTELKSLTEADVPLEEVFTHGNAALCEGNDAGMFVTAWQGGLDLSTGIVRFANAGHNPPLVRHGDGRFEYLKSKVGFVLAGMDGVRYREQELLLQPGDIIYLYTDGVTEAQNADGELYGEKRLKKAINSVEFGSMEELCTYIKGDVDAFVGEAPQFDDITMVALKYIGTPPNPSISFEKAQISDITAITEFLEAELEKLDCPMKTVIQMNIAIDEIYSNIVKYGYPKEPGPVKVEVIHKEEPNAVFIRFEDEGIPYNPLTKEDPDVTLSAEERNIGGLGIYMVKKTMDDMRYKYEKDKNILTIMKKL